MIYRCCDCGNLFEEGEQAVWYENQGECHGVTAMEKFSGCPVCKGDYEEVHQCKKCGDWHTEDELYEGWCETCLRESINYDTFFEYCEANKGENYLDTFVMCYLLNCYGVPKNPSFEFHHLMIEIYKERVKEIKLESDDEFRKNIDILPNCIHFIMEDDGFTGMEDYAHWLNKREVK